MAKIIPGKEEYAETIRYYGEMIRKHKVTLHLNHRVTSRELIEGEFDEVVLCTGVSPRKVSFEGSNHPKVLDYSEVLLRGKEVGSKVAIVGAGGIGFDMAEFLVNGHDSENDVANYMKEWGVDMGYNNPGALADSPQPDPPSREVYLLKRSSGKHGKNLGKTTGWIHRSALAMKQVKMLANVDYHKVSDKGFHISSNGESMLLEVDNVVICAGQEPLRELHDELEKNGINTHLIGGAKNASGLDAKRAIKEATLLAIEL